MTNCFNLVESREFLVTHKNELPGAYAKVRIDKVMGKILGTAYLEDFKAIQSMVDTKIPDNKNLTDLTREIHEFLTDAIIRQMQEQKKYGR